MAVETESQEKTMAKNKRAVNGLLNVIMTVCFLVCVVALFYPFILDRLNQVEQQATVVSYDNRVRGMDPAEKAWLLTRARAYNADLLAHPTGLEPDEAHMAEYMAQLPGDDGIMGHISIPNIGVELMIYHTVEEPVLQVGVGHLPGTSLPVGGPGTHCCLSGHTGLTTANLFTNLDQLVLGDYFYITVLDDVLTYQIDEISVVEPWEVGTLGIDPDKDLCTLITCTPYGINSHRLLVTGHRVLTPREMNEDGSYGSYTIYQPVEDRVGLSLADWLALAGCLVLAVAGFVTVRRIRKKRRARRMAGKEKDEHETEEH